MFIIIGLTGKKQTGKDTVFNILKRTIKPPNRVLRLAFADAVKDEVACACGVTVKEIEADKDTYRPVLQWWGTEFRRKLKGDKYWIDKVCKKIIALTDTNPTYLTLLVVTDVRFQNEADFIKFCNGYIVKVIRPLDNNDTHKSETELDSIIPNHIIDNSNNLQTLESVVELTIHNIIAKHTLTIPIIT